jgi:hypothetical protein
MGVSASRETHKEHCGNTCDLGGLGGSTPWLVSTGTRNLASLCGVEIVHERPFFLQLGMTLQTLENVPS